MSDGWLLDTQLLLTADRTLSDYGEAVRWVDT